MKLSVRKSYSTLPHHDSLLVVRSGPAVSAATLLLAQEADCSLTPDIWGSNYPEVLTPATVPTAAAARLLPEN